MLFLHLKPTSSNPTSEGCKKKSPTVVYSLLIYSLLALSVIFTAVAWLSFDPSNLQKSKPRQGAKFKCHSLPAFEDSAGKAIKLVFSLASRRGPNPQGFEQLSLICH